MCMPNYITNYCFPLFIINKLIFSHVIFFSYVCMYVCMCIDFIIGLNLDAVVSTDNRESTILAALEHGATHYIVKPVCFSDVRNLWQFVVGGNEGTRNPHIVVEQIGSVSGESSSSSNGDSNSKRKRPSQGGKDFISIKKHKVEWTSQLQARFLEAVYCIGLESK